MSLNRVAAAHIDLYNFLLTSFSNDARNSTDTHDARVAKVNEVLKSKDGRANVDACLAMIESVLKNLTPGQENTMWHKLMIAEVKSCVQIPNDYGHALSTIKFLKEVNDSQNQTIVKKKEQIKALQEQVELLISQLTSLQQRQEAKREVKEDASPTVRMFGRN